jgi:hypothetical protein
MRTSTTLSAALGVLSAAISVLAQETTPPVAPPAQTQPPATTPPAKQPTLDDLLGISNEKPAAKPAKPRPEAVDPTRAELERKLSDQEASERFKEAVALMGETAERIQASKDTGLATQRLQEDILRKLDQLIKTAEQNKQQSRSRSQSSQRDRQQPQPDRPQDQQRNPNGKEAAPDTMQPPSGQSAAPNPGVAARGVAWGALPPHLRAALTQGNADKYSLLYQKWTEAFYRRLAEDASK